jgi:hypothetical protein
VSFCGYNIFLTSSRQSEKQACAAILNLQTRLSLSRLSFFLLWARVVDRFGFWRGSRLVVVVVCHIALIRHLTINDIIIL